MHQEDRVYVWENSTSADREPASRPSIAARFPAYVVLLSQRLCAHQSTANTSNGFVHTIRLRKYLHMQKPYCGTADTYLWAEACWIRRASAKTHRLSLECLLRRRSGRSHPLKPRQTEIDFSLGRKDDRQNKRAINTRQARSWNDISRIVAI